MSKTSLKTTVEWKTIPWQKLERKVFKLQKRIYQASQRGDVKTTRRLQKMLMKSWAAKCLSVRRVTQDNQGKKTAGVDGVKSLTPKQRLVLVANLKLSSKVAPTRRVWIPKPGKEEKRPLGIPTMNDRALQALVKLALEPEWEARFEANSYGFRPGRSCHDAVQAIFDAIKFKGKYVLDADIAKCFDQIDHEALLIKLNTFPTIRRQIRAQYEQEQPGFDFLGFTISQYKVGKYHSGKDKYGRLLGIKPIITPSKDKQKVHYEQIAEVINAHRNAPQVALIKKLNPIIRGWANYYATQVSKVAYCDQDYLMYQKLRAWAKRRHPKKSGEWVSNKYWQSIGGDNWVFATRQKGDNPMRLLKHSETPIKRYVKVKGESSPYDGNLVYWSSRMGNSPEMPKTVSTLLKRQKGKCTHCGLTFRENDVMEVDHKIPKSKGGKDSYDNWDLLHRHCHDIKTTSDGSFGTQSGCNSVKPKPTKRLERVGDKWVMGYA